MILLNSLIRYYGKDLRHADFTDVIIFGGADISDLILPNDTELFQKINNKSLFNVKMPLMDYSKYNFDGVCLTGTKFHQDTLLPQNQDFFKRLRYFRSNDISKIVLPKQTMANIHYFDLSNLKFDLAKWDNSITDNQMALLVEKYLKD